MGGLEADVNPEAQDAVQSMVNMDALDVRKSAAAQTSERTSRRQKLSTSFHYMNHMKVMDHGIT